MAPLPLVHADDRLVVVHKPSGLLSVPGRGPDKQDCASARVQQQFADALIVHRLDQATSGLLLLARGAVAQRELSQAFATRRVAKRYLAVVAGCVAQDELEIDLPLLADWPKRPRQMVDAQRGKPSQTRLRVLARAADHTRVELVPLTGRTHQLRVHLMAIGHAILGDALYASPADAARAARLLLHASELLLEDSGQRFYCAPDF
ncbi:RluA family pseudouridine synthase [Paucibacter soli]|uniref:RluA family pseudouridine synthase n=1 Tax=Paucibacter soli TaxID=3133433 RepID=UPI00309B7701